MNNLNASSNNETSLPNLNESFGGKMSNSFDVKDLNLFAKKKITLPSMSNCKDYFCIMSIVGVGEILDWGEVIISFV